MGVLKHPEHLPLYRYATEHESIQQVLSLQTHLNFIYKRGRAWLRDITLTKKELKMNTLTEVTLSLLMIVTMAMCLPTTSVPPTTMPQTLPTASIPQTTMPQTLLGGCENQQGSQSCKLLKELLCLNYRAYRREEIPIFGSGNSLINPFSVQPELYYNHDDFDRTQSSSAIKKFNQTSKILEDVLNEVVTSNSGNGRACSWTYNVTYVPDEFPAFVINAGECTLNTALSGWRCVHITQSVAIVRRENGCWNNAVAPREVKIGCQLVKV